MNLNKKKNQLIKWFMNMPQKLIKKPNLYLPNLMYSYLIFIYLLTVYWWEIQIIRKWETWNGIIVYWASKYC